MCLSHYIGHYDLNYFVVKNDCTQEYELCLATEVNLISGYTDYITITSSKKLFKIEEYHTKMNMNPNQRLICNLYLDKLTIEELQSLKPSIYDRVIDERIKELQDATQAIRDTEESTKDTD